MDYMLMGRIVPFFFQGACVTLGLATLTFFISLLIGAVATMCRLSRSIPLRTAARVYVSIFRGTPCLVQLFIIYFGVSQMGVDLSPFVAAVAGLSLNLGAYMSESIRGAIFAVDRGQNEAARSIGFSRSQAMRYVLIPQAARLMIRSIGINAVMLVKTTSIVSAISVVELTYMSQRFIGSTFKPFEVFALAATMYMVIVYLLSWSVEKLDQRFALN
ncbi:amino acid ABC transporter permease [uncultured Agrobacterium sp.]|uniref:amino acid ABC transporter permease n=1 Tax=uncultured Agrobacterium sp. TaxID=157277 RepID=UPI0025F98BCD|nr:amino acid ABC transporter permease [uncultured Agrobacterium sp.]